MTTVLLAVAALFAAAGFGIAVFAFIDLHRALKDRP